MRLPQCLMNQLKNQNREMYDLLVSLLDAVHYITSFMIPRLKVRITDYWLVSKGQSKDRRDIEFV